MEVPLALLLSNTKEPIDTQAIIEKYNRPYTCVGHLFVLQYRHRQRNWSKQMQSTLKALETSLYWQQVVLKQSKDAKQKERCRVAIEKLQKQIDELQSKV
jgi:hypothetical protein